jgi:hypothetical protein
VGVASTQEIAEQNQDHPELSIVFAYYENPSMLELQWKEISAYSDALKSHIEVIVVDDGSPHNPAAAVLRPEPLPRFSIFHIERDIPWNQDAARNIGAHEAKARWLLLTDIDHVVPEKTLEQILALKRDPDVFYSFGRIKFDSGETRDPHPNSYLMTKRMYWDIGGHDEDFAGIYGKDVLFRARALSHAPQVYLSDMPLARVGSSFVPDAGTTSISRSNTQRMRLKGIVLEWLKRARLIRGVQTLKSPYALVVKG